jgi:AcrR family transcriptional regulator
MPIRNGNGTARRERAREHTRRDILLAAAEVFARRGYAAATLAELADAAGFAAPSLYRYFRSKEEIFRSLVDLFVREMDETFEEPVDLAAPLAGRLEALLRVQARTAESFRSAFAVLDAAGPELADVVPQLRSQRAGIDYYVSRLAPWLERNATKEELRLPPDLVARAFAGIAFALRGSHDDPKPLSSERIRTIVDLALHGFSAPAPRRRGVTP